MEQRVNIDDIFQQWLGTKSHKKTHEVAEEIINILKSYSPKTYKDFEGHWRIHLKDFFADLPVNQIEGKWEVYCSMQRNKNPLRQLVHDKKTMVRILNYSWKNRYLLSQPRPLSILPQDKIPKAVKDLTIDKVKKIIRRLPRVTKSDNWPLLIETLAITGLRFSDVKNLMWEDVDLDTGVITIRAGREKRRISKTNNLDIFLLEKYREREKSSKSPYVFLMKDNPSLPMSDSRVTFYRIKKRLKIDFAIHRLRHFNVSILTQLGIPLSILSQTRGMSNQILNDIYLHNLSTKDANEAFREALGK